MKGIIATRFSSARQLGGTSTETQVEVCQNYCRNNGIEIAGYHKVEAESAKSDNVTRIAELLDFCRKYEGKAEVLVVYKVDRFARDVSQHYYLKKELIKIGISLKSATEPIDDTPQGELMETILAGFAQFDNSVKRERVKLAMWARVNQRLWPWHPPVGYKPNHVPGIKLSPHVFDDTCKDVVKDIFLRYSSGATSVTEIAKELSKRNIKTYRGVRVKFLKQTIHGILNNRFYIGLLPTQDGKFIQGLHEPLIDVPLFEKCQDIMKGLSNHATRKRQYINPDFPLRHFVICAKCSKPITACWAKSGRYPYYYCKNKECSYYSKMIKKSDLENEFKEYLKKVKPSDKFVKDFIAVFIKRYQDRGEELKTDYSRQMEEIDKLTQEEKWLVEKGKKGILPDSLLKQQVDEIENKITLAKLSLSEIHGEELDISADLAYAERFIKTVELAWYDANIMSKVQLQRAIFPEGVKYHDSVFSNSKLSRGFEIINDFASTQTTNVTAYKEIRNAFRENASCLGSPLAIARGSP